MTHYSHLLILVDFERWRQPPPEAKIREQLHKRYRQTWKKLCWQRKVDVVRIHLACHSFEANRGRRRQNREPLVNDDVEGKQVSCIVSSTNYLGTYSIIE